MLHELHDAVAHLWLQGTELVLHIDSVFSTERDQVFALHVEFTSQSEDANFLFLLQAELPCSD